MILFARVTRSEIPHCICCISLSWLKAEARSQSLRSGVTSFRQSKCLARPFGFQSFAMELDNPVLGTKCIHCVDFLFSRPTLISQTPGRKRLEAMQTLSLFVAQTHME